MQPLSSPEVVTRRTLWFSLGLLLLFSLILVLPEALTRPVQVLCGGGALFHLRETMAGRPVRWPWPFEVAFLSACLLGGWALVEAVRLLYA